MSELVTFGETMLRLTPPRGHRLSRVDRLDVHVGGAESNVAVGAANLGVDAAWVSLLPATDLGERIAYALRGEGVEPLVTWTETGRVGTYYFERGGMPRGRDVIYDREGAPIRDATPADAPLDRIRDAGGIAVIPHPFQKSRHGVAPHISSPQLASADAIEIYNSRLLTGIANQRAERFAKRRNLPMTAGSDAHIAEMVGQAVTEVGTDTRSADAILSAVAEGRTSVVGNKTPWRISFRQAAGGATRRLKHALTDLF